MALPSWSNDTVTRIRAGIIVERGTVYPDWDNPDELDISGCSMQPAGTSLSQDGRIQGITDGYTCYMPPGSDVIAGDRIRFNGQDYQVIGEPRAWTSPTGRVSSLQAQLERWSG
jgi:hypothetical protein